MRMLVIVINDIRVATLPLVVAEVVVAALAEVVKLTPAVAEFVAVGLTAEVRGDVEVGGLSKRFGSWKTAMFAFICSLKARAVALFQVVRKSRNTSVLWLSSSVSDLINSNMLAIFTRG
ncbi:hypothetical protein BC829DRAFT_93745 [Chytridium lagenaria]|nr:hypothetical protein BC829DRAFT_93745 [Chytridium lagenaria]